MEQKKKIFGGKKISFFEKTMKKKIGKISEKKFFDFFFRFTHRKIPVFGAHPGQIIFFSKNGLHNFLGEPSGYLHAKFQKNLGCGYREKLVTNGRTDELTNGRTEPN